MTVRHGYGSMLGKPRWVVDARLSHALAQVKGPEIFAGIASCIAAGILAIVIGESFGRNDRIADGNRGSFRKHP